MKKKKVICLLAFCTIFITFFPNLGRAERIDLRIIVPSAEVRLKPEAYSDVIFIFFLGAVLESDKQIGNWYRIILPPDKQYVYISGFIHRSKVRKVQEEMDKRIYAPRPEVRQTPVRRETPRTGEQLTWFPALEGGNTYELRLFYSVRNSYKRGDLDTWFHEQTGDTTVDVNLGSPAFFGGKLGLYYPLYSNTAYMGLSIGGILPVNRSIKGTKLIPGDKQEIILNPQILSLGVPFKFYLGLNRFYLRIAPEMLAAWVTGTYKNGVDYKFVPSIKLGFGFEASLDIFMMKYFGIFVNGGMRFVTTTMTYKDPASQTGYSKLLLNNGSAALVDLGEYFITIGIILGY